MIIEFSNLVLNESWFFFKSVPEVFLRNNEYFLTSSVTLSLSKNNFSSYLAGLIEGDGSIIVPTKNIKSYNPYFEIVFHKDDLSLAEILQTILGGNFKISDNYCVLIIKKKSSVLTVINLINGVMRTPKIEALHRMIDWFNLNNKTELNPLALDYTPILSNYWLAGLIDADGSFYFNWLLDKKGLPTSLQYYMRITQRQNYH